MLQPSPGSTFQCLMPTGCPKPSFRPPQVLGTFHGLNAALLGLGPEDLRVWLEQHGLEMEGYKVVPQNG